MKSKKEKEPQVKGKIRDASFNKMMIPLLYLDQYY